MSKARKLRVQLREKPFLKVMGAHNALGAKLSEASGFDAVWSSGFEIATAHGVPDANILTMTENLDAALNINAACGLPLICDCDTGYGNAINAMHMVRKYEAAGMAALVIEDKRFPKVNSFIPGRQELASIEEFVGKIKAARAARMDDEGVLIFARIEALIAGWGIDEAYKRAVAYYEGGAEGLVIHSKSKTPDEIFTFARMWNKNFRGACPLVAIPTTYYGVTALELEREGFKIAIYANQGMRAGVRAMQEVYGQIQREGTTKNVEGRIASMAELFQLQGMSAYQEHEKQFGGEAEKVFAVIPAAGDHHFQPELSTLLKDQPLCLIPVAGKPLLDRQMELLSASGVQDIKVVVGYKKEKVREHLASHSGVKVSLVDNDAFETKNSAHSVLLGLEKSFGKTVVVYSDIIFDQQILESLLTSPHAVTLVMDRAFRTLPRRDKGLDLVNVRDSGAEISGARNLEPVKFRKIQKIGKKIDPAAAEYEFIGMMMISREGLEMLRALWKDACQKFEGRSFYEAPSVEKCSMTDLFQYAVDQGKDIQGLVIEHGWSELYSLEDYERLERYFTQKSPDLLLRS